MSNPRAQQQAVVAQIKTISQTSITDGLYSLKAFRTFQVSSIQCPSTPHFIAINRGESSWVGPRNMPCPSLCMRRRQTTHTPGFFWEQFQHPAHSAMSPIKHSWFIWILYYNVLNFSCMYPPLPPHTLHFPPPFLILLGEKRRINQTLEEERGGKKITCVTFTHTKKRVFPSSLPAYDVKGCFFLDVSLFIRLGLDLSHAPWRRKHKAEALLEEYRCLLRESVS